MDGGILPDGPRAPVLGHAEEHGAGGERRRQQCQAAGRADEMKMPHARACRHACSPSNHDASKAVGLATRRRLGRARPCGTATRVVQSTAGVQSYLAAQYRRLVKRRGDKKAIVAVAHSILVIAYHVLRDGQSYRELGGDYFDRLSIDRLTRYHTNRLAALGYAVTLSKSAA
jgi:hypothetical protein